MAVVKQPYSCSIKLRYQTGVNAQGNPIFVNRTYGNTKIAAADQDLFDVAQAINSLQSTSLVGVHRTDDSELVNQ